jgi:required for meiotic nuclear division protein 1
MYRIVANQISDRIDLDKFTSEFPAELIYSNFNESFYQVDSEHFVTVLRYGVVCFLDYDDVWLNEFTDIISKYCVYFYDSELTKEYHVEPDTTETKFGFNKAGMTYADIESMRLIMLNVAQSVALDYYFQQARILLEETNKHILVLENKGKLGISDINLKKFIGKTLNLKNQIIENLHIFDSVPETWQNENLNQIDIGMKAALNMEKRSDNIHEELKIVREHLELFSDLMHHSASMKLEWIIIVLVFIEVFDLILKKIL